MVPTLSELIAALQTKQLSSYELIQHSIEQINKHRGLNAFISLDEDYALQQAKAADKARHANKAKLLTGIPLAHKDNFCTQRLNTTCGSKMLADFKAPYQATIVRKLETAGAITLGKTNMDEFAMGSSNETSYFGSVKNPWNKAHVPGGSSGGSAAAVAAGLVTFATGSDTGGSIRQPASFCGISGIKPTYGLISRFGMVAYASSLDQAGPLARSAEDLAIILNHMTGFDPHDATSLNQPVPDYLKTLSHSLQGLRIGLPSCFFQSAAPPALLQAIRQFEEAGAVMVEMELSLQSLWVPCYYVIACAEASSNLSRYDGLRFGYQSKGGKTLQDLIKRSRSEGFGEEVKRRILTGTYVLSSGYFDAYYLQALKIRRLIQEELVNAFKTVDLIAGPTTPTCAFKLGEPVSSPVLHYLADVYTVAANLAGLPAISIPVGFDNQLPVGLQLMGNHFNEAKLLNAAHQYQQMTDWHRQHPPGEELV